MNIETARQGQQSYRPNDEVATQFRGLTVLLFVGPAGVGKSTTLDLITELDPRFRRTGSLGTRAVDTRDKQGLYTQYPREELLEKIAQRTLVQYAVHPTTDSIYATTVAMYQSPFNMLEALPATVDYFHRLDFKKQFVFYMVTEPSAWKKWFESRYPNSDEERRKRAGEAVLSLQWALDQPDESLIWLKNTPSAQGETAKQIILTATMDQRFGNPRNLARQMLEVARQL